MSSAPTLDTRTRILDAAEEVVRTCPDCFTMDRIATDAGVSRATVYRRFGDADGLRCALEDERGIGLAEPPETHTRILDAALIEFLESGVHGATVQAIARRAGLSAMTVYNHFKDKEGLVEALLAERGPGSRRLNAVVTEGGSPQEMLAKVVDQALEMAESQRDIFRLVIAPDPITRGVMRRIRTSNQGIDATLDAILGTVALPDGVDRDVAARALKGMMFANAVFEPIVFGQEVEDRDRLAEQITTLFLRAIGCEDDPT